MDIKYRILPDEDWDQSLSRSIGSTVTGADDMTLVAPGHRSLSARVGVIGTGAMGRAVVTRLEESGLEVVWGSRHPDPDTGQVSVEEAMAALEQEPMMLILAVPSFSWSSLPLSSLCPGCVVLEPSNRRARCEPGSLSQAESLQQLLPPGVTVVKCLNTLSAYELENQSLEAGKQVPIAGDCPQAKANVSLLLERLGYHPKDLGPLQRARAIENIPLALFTLWRRPLALSSLLWALLHLLTLSRSHLCRDNTLGWYPDRLETLFTHDINKTCDSHALILLALCYLPGVLAAYLQLARGTKYSVFPGWLDAWLRLRKQLGLLMLLSASVHATFYTLLYSPNYDQVTIPRALGENRTWDWDTMTRVTGEEHRISMRKSVYLGAGVIGYFVAVILGITSLPSVSSALSWREFRFIQSRLGWLCLLLSTVHCLANGWKKLPVFDDCIFPGSKLTPLILPALTIILKLPLLLPCVDRRLTEIRFGKTFSKLSICC